MLKNVTLLVVIALFVVGISSCSGVSGQSDSLHSLSTQPQELLDASCQTDSTVDGNVSAETSYTTEPEPPHSPLYIDGMDVETVIRYFNEVCLDAEIINSGNASLLQKWVEPIYYMLNGTPTEKDLEVLTNFAAWLNGIEGFPGIYEAQNVQEANLQIYFCTQQEMLALMGEDFTNMDGAVTFWYDENAIFDAIICYRTDLDQHLRNSVILEEIYNGLGPIQDTQLRPDSIIYSAYSQPQSLTEVDELLLKLLYHPRLQCGMNAAECEVIIRQLYY